MFRLLKNLKNNIIYEFRWKREFNTFKSFVRRFEKIYPARKNLGRSAAIVVQPWFMTSVPWFSIVFGLFLSQRGRKITFILDDVMFGNNLRAYRSVLSSIKDVLNDLGGKYDVLLLSTSSLDRAKPINFTSKVKKLVELNTIWFMKGENSVEGRNNYKTLIESQMENIASHISFLLNKKDYEYIFIPGGVYGSSGLWYQFANEKGIRVSSFDSGGPRVLTLCSNGIAAQLQDIPRAFESLQKQPDAKEFILCEARKEMDKRKQGKDRFAYQIATDGACGADIESGVLIPLNSPWDSAALGLHNVFENSTQWIVETVRWILDNTEEEVIIRQHPAERMKNARSTDDYKKVLSECFDSNTRVKFIAADDNVNTYSLLEKVRVVVVYTSTIGVEVATMKKIVITPSNSYYSSLGFVWKADDKKQYFEMINRAIKGESAVTDEQAEAAWYCYYLGQCCNWITSEFSPESFERWVKLEPKALFEMGIVQELLSAVDENIPISLLRHGKKRTKEC